MTFEPLNGYVLCKKIVDDKKKVVVNNFECIQELLPIYQVLKTSDLSIDLDIAEGDKLVTNSIPTKIKQDSGDLYLINQEYIAGKIVS